jgi:hypothetical protein
MLRCACLSVVMHSDARFSFLPPSYLQPEAQKHGTIFIGTPFLVSGVGLKTLSWEAIWVRDMSLIG